MTTRNLFNFLLLFFLFTISFINTGCRDNNNKTFNDRAEDVVVQGAKDKGFMNPDDCRKILKLEDDLSQHHRHATEDEVLWALSLVKQADHCKETWSKVRNYSEVSDIIGHSHGLSEPTRKKAHEFAMLFLSLDNPAASTAVANLLTVIGTSEDIPTLKAMLKENDSNVTFVAQRALDILKKRGIQ